MATGDVARALQLSTSRVQQLDEELKPIFLPGSRRRRYDPALVQRFATKRAKLNVGGVK